MKVKFKIPDFLLMIACSALCLITCKKDPVPPVVTTSGVSAITQTTATSGGNVTGEGGAEVTARGVCWNTTENPTVSNNKTSDGAGTGTFTSNLTQLKPGTKYYVRAYATNEAGTGYGNQQSFNTGEVSLATLTTADITSPTQTSAVSGGNVTSDGGGVVTARGVCWNTSQNPTIANSKTTDGSGTGSFTSNITGLTAGTPYYVRAYATNGAGTAYGSQKDFITTEAVGAIVFNPALTYGTVSDIDGNIYKTIQIGIQTWMAENLRTTKYNNNTQIPLIEDDTEWKDLTTDAYCWYNNDVAAYKTIYGALYNFYAVDNGNLCPTGWHVPTYDELNILQVYLGDFSGYKLIEIGTIHWKPPNNGATNETGFTWLPAGERAYVWGDYRFLGEWASFWSSSATSWDGHPAGYVLGYGTPANNAGLYTPPKQQGHSVRCLKN